MMQIHSEKKKETSESITIILLKFSLPLILSGILQQLYNWADAFIVGNVNGETALAAVGSTTTIVNFFLMMITGFCVGLAILFGQKFGRGQTEEIPKILSTFSLLLGGIFLLFSILGMLFIYPILQALNTTSGTIHLAQDYLQIIFAGIPFLAVYNVYSSALRGIGDSRAPFLAIVISAAVNILLDLLFVAVFRWNVTGAAIATVIAQITMTIFLILYSIKKHPILRFCLNRRAFCPECLRSGVHFGVPPMIQSTVNACGSLILQNFMNGFGTQTVAAITTAYRVDTIVLLPIINLGSGISTLVAQSHGAGDRDRARKVLSRGTISMFVIALLLTLAVIPTGGHLVALFGVGTEAIAIGTGFFRRTASFYVIYGLATSIRGYLEGLGDVLYSSIAGIIALIFRIIASYALADVFGNMIIAYAEAFSWCLLLLLYAGRLLYQTQRSQKAK